MSVFGDMGRQREQQDRISDSHEASHVQQGRQRTTCIGRRGIFGRNKQQSGKYVSWWETNWTGELLVRFPAIPFEGGPARRTKKGFRLPTKRVPLRVRTPPSRFTFLADIPLLFMYVMGRRIPTDLPLTVTEQYSPWVRRSCVQSRATETSRSAVQVIEYPPKRGSSTGFININMYVMRARRSRRSQSDRCSSTAARTIKRVGNQGLHVTKDIGSKRESNTRRPTRWCSSSSKPKNYHAAYAFPDPGR